MNPIPQTHPQLPLPTSHQRKLVTIRPITHLRPLRACNRRFELATVRGGWTVAVRKGEWKAGEQVLYFEIDSFVPARDGRFDWEDYGSLVSYDGEIGYHVRSRVYGRDISQGLVLDTVRLPEVEEVLESLIRELGPVAGMMATQEIAFEEVLDVRKLEPLEEDRGRVLGRAPPFFRCPGCERVQNLPELFTARYLDRQFQVTEKIDGVSMTVYQVQKGSQWHACLPALSAGSTQEDQTCRVGVASRTEDLDEMGSSVYCQAAKVAGLPGKIHRMGLPNVIVQGELVGPNIKNNSLRFAPDEPHRFVVFQVYNIDTQKWMDPGWVVHLCEALGLPHVPVVGRYRLREFAAGLGEMLGRAEGVEFRGQTREGLVFKMCGDEFAFKVISNK